MPDRLTWSAAVACMLSMLDDYREDSKGVHDRLVRCPDCDGNDDECATCGGSGEVVKGATDECE
jgi:hypothetical protein